MALHRARMLRAGSLAFVLTGTGCGLILGLDGFEDAPAPDGEGSGGGDSAGICRPEAQEPCYSGPAGTEKTGLCRPGTRTCDGRTETWGACEGEVLPQQESCASTEDENCDGFDCALWARTIETSDSRSSIHAITTDSQGNTIAAGSFTGSLLLGAEPLIGADHNEQSALDAFIVSLGRSGDHRWSYQFSDTMNQEATSACVDSSDNVIVAGINDGNIKIGKSDIGPGIFVAKFSSDGEIIWSTGIAGSSTSDPGFLPGIPKIKSTPDGDVILAGSFAGTLRFEDTEFTTYPADTPDIYVARINGKTGSWSAADGGWIQRFKSNGNDTLAGVAVHTNDKIIVTGHFSSRIEFGNIAPTADEGMFLVNLDRKGTPTWARGFANAQPAGLSVDALGNISATGIYEHPADFGGGDLPDLGDAFAAQFDSAGNHRWSRGFIGNITTSSISADPLGNVFILSSVAYDVRIDDGEILYVREMPSPMAIKLDAMGKTVWKDWFPVEPFGAGLTGAAETGSNSETVIAGRVVATTEQITTIDFGSGPQPTGHYSLFIAKLGK